MDSKTMPEAHPGKKALQHIAEVLNGRPEKNDGALAMANRCLAAFREELIERVRHAHACDGDREKLGRLNAIISLVMGMHFPLGNPPWGEFEKAEVWLRDLVADIER